MQYTREAKIKRTKGELYFKAVYKTKSRQTGMKNKVATKNQYQSKTSKTK